MNKKILVVCEESNEYSAIHKSFYQAFKDYGCDTDLFIAPVYPYLLQKLSGRIPFIHLQRQKKNLQLLKEFVISQKYNAIFILKGNYLNIDLLKELKFLNPSVKFLCFNPDDPFNQRVSIESCRQIIPICDTYFIWTKHMITKLKVSGAKNVVYLPFALDKNLIYQVNTEIYKYDISFIGNGDLEREQAIIKLCEAIHNRNQNSIIQVFGDNWHLSSKYVQINKKKNGKDYLETINYSKININLLRLQNKNSINMRTFEIPGAGGFMMHENSEEAKEFFFPDKEAVYFSTAEEFTDKVHFYLKNEPLRKKIAIAGYNKAISFGCSYQERIEKILNTL